MERTGHHSIDGVRNYKRTSNDQLIAISDVLNGMPSNKKVKSSSITSSTTTVSSGINGFKTNHVLKKLLGHVKPLPTGGSIW